MDRWNCLNWYNGTLNSINCKGFPGYISRAGAAATVGISRRVPTGRASCVPTMISLPGGWSEGSTARRLYAGRKGKFGRNPLCPLLGKWGFVGKEVQYGGFRYLRDPFYLGAFCHCGDGSTGQRVSKAWVYGTRKAEGFEMIEVNDFWKKRAINLRKGFNQGVSLKIKKDYIPVGDYVGEILGITDIKEFDTTVRLLFDHINKSRDVKNFICVKIGKSQITRGYFYGFLVKKTFKWQYREAI